MISNRTAPWTVVHSGLFDSTMQRQIRPLLSAAESKALELAKKSARMAMFRDTSGGAYSYLDAEGRMFVPGADNTVVMIPIRDHRIIRDEMVLLDLNREIEQGSWAEVVWRMVGGRIAEAWDIPAVHTARPQTH